MQRINLCPNQDTPLNVQFSFVHMILCMLACIALFFLISVGTFIAQYKAQYDVGNFKSTADSLNDGLTDAKRKIFSEEERQALIAHIDKLEQQRAHLEKMATTLQQLQLNDKPGFSEYFAALSRYGIPGLWLTKFVFAAGGNSITLEGSTVDAEFVPKLVQRLGNDEVFAGKKFKNFKIYTKNKTEADQNGKTKPSTSQEILFKIGSS